VRSLDELQQPFFFLLGPPGAVRFDRSHTTDLFIDGDQFRRQFLEAVKLAHFLGRFPEGGRSSERFGDAAPLLFACETELRVAGILGQSAMASWFATVTRACRDGSGAQIAQGEHVMEYALALYFESGEGLRHE
jgi:hypothetical protein